MKSLAERLSHESGRPVIDKTGIQETFDFALDVSAGGENDDRPSLSAALQRELGLKLNATKGPVEMLVVDRADRTPASPP